MGLLAKALGRTELSTISPLNAWLTDGDWWGFRTAAGRTVNSDNALKVSAVMACVKVLSETLAIMPLKVYRKKPGGGRTEADGLPLFDVLGKNPNPWMTSFEWVELIMNHLTTRGNHYSLKVPGEYGAVTWLVPLHPDKVALKKERQTGAYFYEVHNENGGRDVYTLDEILHIRGMTAGDGMVGLNPIAYMRETIGLDMGAEEFGASFFGSAGIPKVVLETDQKMNLNDRNELAKHWDERYSGKGNHNRTAVASHNLKVKVVSIPPEDSQFIETRKMTKREIASLYRVPLHMIGDLERSTNNNIEHQSLEFLMYTMLPWIRRVETSLDSSLLPSGGRYFTKFNVEGLLRGDNTSRIAWYRGMREMGVLSADEIRQHEDMEPIGEKSGGEKRFFNAAYVELSKAGDPELGKPSVPASPSPDTRHPDQQNSEAKSKIRLMILSEIGKLVRWEIAETNKLSHNAKDFTAKIEAFHGDHRKRMTEKMTPLCELLDVMGEKSLEKLENAVKNHFSSSFEAILSAMECPADKLTESVSGMTEKWDSRVLKVVEELGI